MVVAWVMVWLILVLKSVHQVAGRARSCGTMVWWICSASVSVSWWSGPTGPAAGLGRDRWGWSWSILLQVEGGRELLAGLAEPVADGAGRLAKGLADLAAGHPPAVVIDRTTRWSSGSWPIAASSRARRSPSSAWVCGPATVVARVVAWWPSASWAARRAAPVR